MTAGMCLALSICDKITWFKHQVLNPYAYTRTFIYRYCSRSKKFKSVWNHIFILPFSPLQTNKQNQQLPNRIFVNWRRRRNTIVTPQLKCIFVWFFLKWSILWMNHCIYNSNNNNQTNRLKYTYRKKFWRKNYQNWNESVRHVSCSLKFEQREYSHSDLISVPRLCPMHLG